MATEQDDVRADARAWIEANWDPEATIGEWWDALAAGGWSMPTWPEGCGGRGLPAWSVSVVAEELRRAGAFGCAGSIALAYIGPTIAELGNPEQQARYLPPIVTGRESWCQLFSEPGAGSDLAGLQTRAVRDGEEWVVTGQKVWTTGGHRADLGMLLARTDVDVPKHQGITWFVIDMRQPGVEVRPLKQMTGGAEFNEVFFDEARARDTDVVGGLNNGWSVANRTLSYERTNLTAPSAAVGVMGDSDEFRSRKICDFLAERAKTMASAGAGMPGGRTLIRLSQTLGRNHDPVVRQELAAIYTLNQVARYNQLRIRARAKESAALLAIQKLASTNAVRRAMKLGMTLEGADGMLVAPDAPRGGTMQAAALRAPSLSIAGGTDEVQRNVIAERSLGLPKDPSSFDQVPFRDLPVGIQR